MKLRAAVILAACVLLGMLIRVGHPSGMAQASPTSSDARIAAALERIASEVHKMRCFQRNQIPGKRYLDGCEEDR